MSKGNNSIALYRKYRGLTFDDIVGQDHITSVLKKAVASDRISHAYLFTGPRGVGKTSVARILAHAINHIDYKHEDNHIDIIEIDAASNRRIDEIRDLREKSHIAPVSAKYKVYIIDEVHMLTKEAFNALLKTLEEPPAHVVFILATTEAHKLPQTIVSRTQRHTFRPITEATAKEHLSAIAQKEKIKIDDDALTLVSHYGDGSFRDAIGLLDQLASSTSASISESDVRQTLGLVHTDEVQQLFRHSAEGNQADVSKSLQNMSDKGVQAELLAGQLIDFIQSSDFYIQHLDLVAQLIEVPSHAQPALKLEITLLGYNRPTKTPEKQPKVAMSEPAETPEPPKTESIQQAVPIEESTKPVKSYKPYDQKVTAKQWAEIINSVKQRNNALASILRSAPPEFENGKLTILVKFDFHKKKLNDNGAPKIIADAMHAVLGGIVDYEIEVDPSLAKHEITSDESESTNGADDIADSIISTFGGGEKVNI